LPIPKISVRALQAFIAVYEEQSFSRAARRENATQSGMSTQVKNLEAKLGTPLLLRSRGQIGLTEAGRLVYREGQGILKALLRTETAVREMQETVSGLVRFGMIPSLTRSVLSPALERFKAAFPHVTLSLLEEYSFSLMRRVLDGELDFAVVPSGDIPVGLTATFVGRDREMLAGRVGGSPDLPHLSPVPLRLLSGARLIVPSAQNVRRRQIETTLGAHGIHPAELLEMDGMLGTLEMVAATDWVSVLPSAICHADRDGTQRKLHAIAEPPMSLDYVIVEKAETSLPRAARPLADLIITHTNAVLSDWDDIRAIA
jgi:DNA-binding transcriptional LysR family regulator